MSIYYWTKYKVLAKTNLGWEKQKNEIVDKGGNFDQKFNWTKNLTGDPYFSIPNKSAHQLL